jgi:hypothetical protein
VSNRFPHFLNLGLQPCIFINLLQKFLLVLGSLTLFGLDLPHQSDYLVALFVEALAGEFHFLVPGFTDCRVRIDLTAAFREFLALVAVDRFQFVSFSLKAAQGGLEVRQACFEVGLLLGFGVCARGMLLCEFGVEGMQTLVITLLLSKIKDLSLQGCDLEVLVVILSCLL